MNNLNLNQLKQLAISAAKAGDWIQAQDANLEILSRQSHDVAALNRLGVAYTQQKKHKLAKEAFEKVIKVDKTNLLAKKNLARLKNTKHLDINLVGQEDFIEEPGKTRVVELHRLAGKQVLEILSSGMPCTLKVKKRYISVEAGEHYIGALPEDLSFRLTKLINSGNTYRCFIRSISGLHVSVYLREETRAVCNGDNPSFPVSKPVPGTDEEFGDDGMIKDEGFSPTFGEYEEDNEPDTNRIEVPDSNPMN